MKSLFNELVLVYPPFSNQEGDWFWDCPEVRECVKHSKLYMIVHREEIKFTEYNFIPKDHGYIEFRISSDSYTTPKLRLSTIDIFEHFYDPSFEEGMNLEMGDKLFRASIGDDLNRIIFWFTPDKLIFDYNRGLIGLLSNEPIDLSPFCAYDLLYVGISKNQNSFSRLFKSGHHKRLKILTNESPKSMNARLTDELLILLFDIDQTCMKILDDVNLIDDFLSTTLLETNKVIAEAEKAFVYFLKSKYNEVQFTNYPQGSDGLMNAGLDRYAFRINENIILKTEKESFVAFRDIFAPQDVIVVNGNTATLYKFEDEK